MRSSRFRLFVAWAAMLNAALLSGCASQKAGADPSRAVQLFDGTTLNGWTQRGGKAAYSAEDGCIVGRTAPNQPNSFLCTTRSYADFELELDFKVDPALNSGVQIRSESTPEFEKGRVHGYQVEIDPSERAWTGGLYDEGRRGWLVDLKNDAPARAAFRRGEWNHLRIVARGDTFNTWVNGVAVVRNFHDSMTPSGFIALQVHDVGPRVEPLEVRWKNFVMREYAGEAP